MRDVNKYSGRFHTFHHVSPGLSNLDRGFLADGSSCLFVRLIWYKHGDWGSHWRHHKLCLWNQVELCCSSAIPLKGYDSAEFEGLEKWERQLWFLPTWCFANIYIYIYVLLEDPTHLILSKSGLMKSLVAPCAFAACRLCSSFCFGKSLHRR